MKNLRDAWEQRLIVEYGKLLNDQFQFFFDPADGLEQYQGSSWTRAQELSAAASMFKGDAGFDLVNQVAIPPVLSVEFTTFAKVVDWSDPGTDPLYAQSALQRRDTGNFPGSCRVHLGQRLLRLLCQRRPPRRWLHALHVAGLGRRGASRWDEESNPALADLDVGAPEVSLDAANAVVTEKRRLTWILEPNSQPDRCWLRWAVWGSSLVTCSASRAWRARGVSSLGSSSASSPAWEPAWLSRVCSKYVRLAEPHWFDSRKQPFPQEQAFVAARRGSCLGHDSNASASLFSAG